MITQSLYCNYSVFTIQFNINGQLIQSRPLSAWLSYMIPTVVFCHARYYLLHYTALSHTKPFLWLKILDGLPVGYGILYLRAC